MVFKLKLAKEVHIATTKVYIKIIVMIMVAGENVLAFNLNVVNVTFAYLFINWTQGALSPVFNIG